MPSAIRYELERDKNDGGKTYYVYKVFNNGTRLLWARFLLRQQAVRYAKLTSFKDRVPFKIMPGVFRKGEVTV